MHDIRAEFILRPMRSSEGVHERGESRQKPVIQIMFIV
jgi:hypothetical protein